MSQQDNNEQLNEALVRLSEENKNWRDKNENMMVLLRKRASNTDGMTSVGAVKNILDERDTAVDRVQDFRNELKIVLETLINMDDKDTKVLNELRKQINLFLVKNPR